VPTVEPEPSPRKRPRKRQPSALAVTTSAEPPQTLEEPGSPAEDEEGVRDSDGTVPIAEDLPGGIVISVAGLLEQMVRPALSVHTWLTRRGGIGLLPSDW
jgi:hypothetical protein